MRARSRGLCCPIGLESAGYDLVGQRGSILVARLRLSVRPERRRAIACADKHRAGLCLHLLGVRIVWRRAVGVEVVGGYHLDHLVVIAKRAKMRGGREMT